MSDEGTSVTLIFYKIGEQFWKEPLLNIVAAAAQMSPFTHVEIALGEDSGVGGQMTNVARVFNDAIGVELTERTGRNPAYTYLSLGCSKASLHKMVSFARRQIGKPFSNYGMAMALIAPRKNDGTSWFCAELVSAILQEGNLLSSESNAAAATPQSLYKLYSKKAAATANPYTLRTFKGLTFNSVAAHEVGRTHAHAAAAAAAQGCACASSAPGAGAGGCPTNAGARSTLANAHAHAHAHPAHGFCPSSCGSHAPMSMPQPHAAFKTSMLPAPVASTSLGARRRCDSPPKAAFRVLQTSHGAHGAPPLGLSFESLRS